MSEPPLDFLASACPSFWLGIMLILLLAGVLNILPTAGRSTYGIAGPETTGFYLLDSLLQKNWKAVWDALTHICMPALALGVNMLGILMRVTRSSVLEVMNEEYVVTARAKGLREKTLSGVMSPAMPSYRSLPSSGLSWERC